MSIAASSSGESGDLPYCAAGSSRSRRTPLQMGVGLATGLAVVGDLIGSGAAREEAVVGETPNLAARLQALAEPDAVVIAETARGGGAQRQPKRERSREPTVNRKWGTQCH